MSNNDHDDDRKDLTRIEDLSEFLHEENPEIDSRLNSFNQETPNLDFTNTNIESGLDISSIDDLPSMPDVPEESPPDSLPEEVNFSNEILSNDSLTQDFPTDEALGNEHFGDTIQESDISEDALPQFPIEALPEDNTFENLDSNGSVDDFSSQSDFTIEADHGEQFSEELNNFEESHLAATEDPESTERLDNSENLDNQYQDYSEVEEVTSTFHEPEKFDEVKTFAHTFSYGQVSVGGNPPFSIIVRNIKFKEDAEAMLSFLKEFGVVTDKNLNETKMALDIGSLLIPQISEFAAIVLAHKFRRFDCDIEFGLSEEIHPTKIGESYNKGLTNKESIRQNKIDSFKKLSPQVDINDILVSTTSSLEGLEVIKYLGVHSSLAIIEADELERLKFVQSAQRSKSQVFSTETDDSDSMTTEQAFEDYQKSFDSLFSDLVDQLKQKAFKENANALLGLNYQMTQLPLNSKNKKQLNFQLVCSATLALVKSK